MKNNYGEKLNLKVYTTDAEEAQKYVLKGSTTVLFEKETVPLDIALDKQRMDAFLSSKL